MKLYLFILTCLISQLPGTSFARGEDLTNCRFSDGQSIPSSLCERFRQQEIAEKKRLSEQTEANRRQDQERLEKRRLQEQELLEKRQKRAEEIAKEDAERQQRLARQKAESEREEAEARKQQKIAAETTKERKERCGEDYGTLKIGMALSRALDCSGRFKLQGQTNRHDGVVSTYSGGGKYFHVMDGKIVSWGSY